MIEDMRDVTVSNAPFELWLKVTELIGVVNKLEAKLDELAGSEWRSYWSQEPGICEPPPTVA